MINTSTEQMLTLSAAAREVPGRSGPSVNTSTIWRWTLRGIRGHKLESIMCGGIRMTSREAIQRFFAAVTDAQASGVTPCSHSAGREREIAAANQILDDAGIN